MTKVDEHGSHQNNEVIGRSGSNLDRIHLKF